MDAKDGYYIGLDCGTSSVGWAVTDEKYKLLRRKGKTMWGMRLFGEAQTAADRRTARSTRRRLARAKSRIKLLQMLFSDEIAKVDSDFYIRLRESFFLEEDKKGLASLSKNTLFNDVDFKDKDYHKKYPTIWHLRNAILQNDEEFDIRLFYLAIEHIIKHRGHFLREGELEGAGNFDELWGNFCAYANEYGFSVRAEYGQNAKELLGRKMSKMDKKKQLGTEMFDVAEEDFSGESKELAALLCGSNVSLKKMFGLDAEEDLKLSFAGSSAFEDNVPIIEEYLTDVDGGMDIILAAKQIYDYVYLSDLLRGSKSISAAMVKNYEQHQQDLREIKAALRPFAEDYNFFFKNKENKKEGEVYYAAYVGQGYSQDRKGRKKSYTVSQEDINKELKKIFEKNGIGGDLLARAEEGSLLPKQRGFAKGTIPQQLHHNELRIILQKLGEQYPSFAEEVAGESEEYNTKLKKIERIHDFRIPYYCGPMLTRGEKKTVFAWADSEIKEIVRPWNYHELVNKRARADAFIKRMTNECTYVAGADVLPKSSLIYQKYMVLNELNNLGVDGDRKRIDNDTKQKIFERAYLGGELKKNSILKLAEWMHANALLGDGENLSGAIETKNLPKLSTHADFVRILGEDYAKRYSEDKLEQVIELITILNNEREMLTEKIIETLGCSEEQAAKLARLNYKDWGKLSAKFLKGIYCDINGRRMNILDALWETQNNLMELLSSKYGFKAELERINLGDVEDASDEISYEMVKNLYCSPAVKRTVWQAIKIVKEIKEVMGYAPKKIFLEVTRGEEKGEKKIKLARRKDLMEKYKRIKAVEAKELFDELDQREDRELQSKKLFLYYCQMGKCAYCGKHIDLEEINNNQLYDIDHIYPRSKTKDDSITRNLVLVCAPENREKTNRYPLDSGIREKMRGIWGYWRSAELITKEKYERLVRAEALTEDELANFISRQLVETSQSVKAIRDLLAQHMPETKVVMVKAGNTHDLRDFYGLHGDSLNGLEMMPEFIKIRELNDVHHAKDAYLNIVVGNVINATFTDNPREWIRRKKDSGYHYSIRTERLFRNSENYKLADNVESNVPEVMAWDYAESIKIMSETMKRNDVLWTRMLLEQTQDGAISKATIVGKNEDSDGILPIKKNIDPKKYGGYTSIQGAYFALIEVRNKKGEANRKIVQVPILAKAAPREYLEQKYEGATIILDKIPVNALIKADGALMTISGRSGSTNRFAPAIQLHLPVETYVYLKRILKVAQKVKENKKYLVDVAWDKVSKEENEEFLDCLLERLNVMKKMPYLGSFVERAKESRMIFCELNIEKQCEAIAGLIVAFGCNTAVADLSMFVSKGGNIGKCIMSNDITKLNECWLLRPSVTGLFEKKPIDLLHVRVGEI